MFSPDVSASPSPDQFVRSILLDEIRRAKPILEELGIAFSVCRAKVGGRNGKARKLPYFACCYNFADLREINIIIFVHPLLADWKLMDGEYDCFRRRVRSGIEEEIIHTMQVATARDCYEGAVALRKKFRNAEEYYHFTLKKIIAELGCSPEGCCAILNSAQLYYEDWTIASLPKLRETDRQLHGRTGYLAVELIRQLVQIRTGEMISEEAKGKAWDRNRVFDAGRLGTSERLLRAMADLLRQAAPQLVLLSRTLAEVLAAVEDRLQIWRNARKTTPPAPLALSF